MARSTARRPPATAPYAMPVPRALVTGVLLAGVLAGLLSGCSAGSGDSLTDGDSAPRSGGTLRLAGSGEIGSLDPAAAASSPAYELLRAVSRQLVTYPATATPARAGAGTSGAAGTAVAAVPDLAEAPPMVQAGPGSGTTYTFRLRGGVSWDTTPPRPVTAADVERGFRRLCNPVSSAGMPAYLPGLVAGMPAYCAGFARVAPDAVSIKRYIDTHRIPGVRAVDDRTVRLVLTRPAGDILDILAMPFASPVPVEALSYVPGSPELAGHLPSSGPYRVARTSARFLVLERNPAWRPDADPVRRAYVDRIEVSTGADAAAVQRRLEAGGADLSWDTDVPAAAAVKLSRRHDAGLAFVADSPVQPYLVANTASANENRAMANQRVRQALNYAVDKSAIVSLLGGAPRFQPHDQVLPPAAPGFEEFNLYPTPDHRGDPATAKQILDDAGYPHGLTLTLSYPATEVALRVAGALETQLAKAGVRLRLSSRPEDEQVTAAPEGGHGQAAVPEGGDASWDLALADISCDWAGAVGRELFSRMLTGFTDGELRRLADRAGEATGEEAAEYWAQADRRAMQLAVWVPLATSRGARYHASRVHGWTPTVAFPHGDPTNVWVTR